MRARWYGGRLLVVTLLVRLVLSRQGSNQVTLGVTNSCGSGNSVGAAAKGGEAVHFGCQEPQVAGVLVSEQHPDVPGEALQEQHGEKMFLC